MIMEYKIKSGNTKELAILVNQALADGWELRGELVKGKTDFHQVLVKKTATKEKTK